MCGICGIVKFNSESVNIDRLNAMTDSLEHRGPDGRGIYLNESESIGFGHRRLSIIDLDQRSSQPFEYQHLTITYNGEIYNYLELRDELSGLGHVFNTKSDTEVLIVAYLEWGSECLDKLDGMFSFVIHDRIKMLIFGARDRFGEKPFFYAKNDSEFVFASEIKAIATYKKALKVKPEAVYRYLVYDIVENPDDLSECFFEDIKKLPPAHYIQITEGESIEINKYWEIDLNKSFEGSFEEASNEFQTVFKESVKLRLRSDVAVGTSLSGGLDSSSIISQIAGSGNDGINTFTARFDDNNLDEGRYVDELEKKFNFQRNDVWPQPEELTKQLSEVFFHQEEPFGSASIFAQYQIMKKAKEGNVTVLLDGQGGDEVLAGYEKYLSVALAEIGLHNPLTYLNFLRKANQMPGVHIGIRELLSGLFPATFDKLRKSPIAGRRKSEFEANLGEEILPCAKNVDNPFHSFKTLNQALSFDAFQYGLGKLLRFSDRNSMAHSREVRLPFLSHKLVELVFSLPAKMKINPPWTKYILRHSMRANLPEKICWRKDKKGFAPPQNDWMKSNEVKKLIAESEIQLIDRKVLKKDHNCDHWQVVMIAQVYKFAEGFLE